MTEGGRGRGSRRSERKWIRGMKWGRRMWPPGYPSLLPSETGRPEQGWVDRWTGLHPISWELAECQWGARWEGETGLGPGRRWPCSLLRFLPGRKQVLPGARPVCIVLAPPRTPAPDPRSLSASRDSMEPAAQRGTVTCPRSGAGRGSVHPPSRVATASSSSL